MSQRLPRPPESGADRRRISSGRSEARRAPWAWARSRRESLRGALVCGRPRSWILQQSAWDVRDWGDGRMGAQKTVGEAGARISWHLARIGVRRSRQETRAREPGASSAAIWTAWSKSRKTYLRYMPYNSVPIQKSQSCSPSNRLSITKSSLRTFCPAQSNTMGP